MESISSALREEAFHLYLPTDGDEARKDPKFVAKRSTENPYKSGYAGRGKGLLILREEKMPPILLSATD